MHFFLEETKGSVVSALSSGYQNNWLLDDDEQETKLVGSFTLFRQDFFSDLFLHSKT
jgi:hypothetical protein